MARANCGSLAASTTTKSTHRAHGIIRAPMHSYTPANMSLYSFTKLVLAPLEPPSLFPFRFSLAP